jgi:hypothetical protein
MQHLLTMMLHYCHEDALYVGAKSRIKFTSSFSLEMAAFHFCLPRTECHCRRQHTQNAIVDGNTSF